MPLCLIEEVLVKCSQTGRRIKAKVSDISKKDNTSVTQTDLKKGSSLLVAVTGKTYPVEFIEFAGMLLVFVWTVY